MVVLFFGEGIGRSSTCLWVRGVTATKKPSEKVPLAIGKKPIRGV